MQEAVILSAVRTPIGKFCGALKNVTATRLGQIVVGEAVRRAGVEPARVDEVIMGNVISAGLGQNPARQAAIRAGIPPEASAFTVNKVCGSGLKAVALAAQAVETENAGLIVAGGMESMSNGPYLLRQMREGYRLGHGTLVDAVIHDGLWDAYEDFHMGCTGEIAAERYGVTREAQDAFALASHRKAVAAMREGRFRDQIVEVDVPGRKPVVVGEDESPRPDASLEALSALPPVFREDGTVTAGNAPGMNDGAAAVVIASLRAAREASLPVLARIRGQASAGIAPALAMMAPVGAVRKLLAKTGWDLGEVELIELNEAFSAQALAVIGELGLDPDRVNVCGGAVALGHPIGASGARILVTLLHEMKRRGAGKGIATLCLGGGGAVALAVEAV